MKITLIILLVLCTSCFAQTPYITDVTSRGIEYSLFDNDTILLAKNMLYVPSSTSLTNAQMKAELLAEVDSVKNLDIAGLDSVVIDIGNGWNLVIDSTLVEQNTFNIHYRVLDNTYVAAHDSVAAIGQVLVDTKPIDNTVEYGTNTVPNTPSHSTAPCNDNGAHQYFPH